MSYKLFFALCIWIFTALAIAAEENLTSQQEQLVQNYTAAFNRQDVDAMMNFVATDIQWLSVNGEKLTLEANGKTELRRGMQEYFATCSSCKSRLQNVFSSGTRVSALEIASFATAQGKQSQQSMSIYEFSGLLIKRVYYFPAEDVAKIE